MIVAVLGLGCVGTVPTAVLASESDEAGGDDIDPGKVTVLSAGRSSVVEPGLDDLARQTLFSGSLRTTNDVGEALAQAETFIGGHVVGQFGDQSSPMIGVNLLSISPPFVAIGDQASAL